MALMEGKTSVCEEDCPRNCETHSLGNKISLALSLMVTVSQFLPSINLRTPFLADVTCDSFTHIRKCRDVATRTPIILWSIPYCNTRTSVVLV